MLWKSEYVQKWVVKTCLSCGSLHSYEYVTEFVNFHENKYRIKRKSVYHRKYYIEILLNDISQKNDFQISVKDGDKIMRIFKEIGKVLHLVNGNKRKRMINARYILKQIFLMLDLNCHIQTSKSRKTLAFYENYWVQILLLIFDKIMKIIRS